MKLIDKDALVAEIERLKADALQKRGQCKRSGLEKIMHLIGVYNKILSLINTLEVIDPYEQCIQYASIESGIKAHAEDYSWNIESELFQQLTPEQQKLWRKEIEQACISGGYSGLNLAKDLRYKENLEVKEVDFEEELKHYCNDYYNCDYPKQIEEENCSEVMPHIVSAAKHFFELGISVSNKVQKL